MKAGCCIQMGGGVGVIRAAFFGGIVGVCVRVLSYFKILHDSNLIRKIPNLHIKNTKKYTAFIPILRQGSFPVKARRVG